MADEKLLKVSITDAEKIIFDGDADRISSFNEVGPFDIYPMHANFISILQKEITLYHQGKIIKQMKIEKAILKVKQDIVKIFLGIEAFTLDEEISKTSAKIGN